METTTILTPQEIEGLRAAGRAPGETLLEFVGRLNASRRRAQGEVAEALAIVQREMELEPGTRLAEAVEMLAADDRELARRLEESTVTALQEANEHEKAEAERKAKTEERERRFAAEVAEWRRKWQERGAELADLWGRLADLRKRLDVQLAAVKSIGRTAASVLEGDAEAEKANAAARQDREKTAALEEEARRAKDHARRTGKDASFPFRYGTDRGMEGDETFVLRFIKF